MLLLILSIFLFVAVLMCFISYRFYKKMWNPVFLFYIMFITGVLLASQDRLIVDSKFADGILWLFVGTTLFSCAFLCAQICQGKGKNPFLQYQQSALKWMSNLCVLTSLITMIVFYKIVIDIAGDISVIFLEGTRVRNGYLEREASGLLPMFSFFITINFYTSLSVFPEAIKKKIPYIRLKLVLVLLFQFLSSIISMSKEHFIIICIVLITIFSNQSKGFKDEARFIKRYAPLFLFFIIMLIYGTSVQRGYVEGNKYESYTDAIIDVLFGYIGIPITAFCQLISFPSRELYGDLCFRPLFSILSRFGLAEKVSSIQDPVNGMDTNVFTFWGDMYTDYGLIGIVIVSIIWGGILGILYKNRRSNRLSMLTINSIVTMTMFFAFYDFILMQTVYLLSMIYSVVFERLFNKYIYLKN